MKEGFDCSVSAVLGFFPNLNFPERLPNKGRGGGAATTGSSPFLESLGEPEFLPAPRDRATIAAPWVHPRQPRQDRRSRPPPAQLCSPESPLQAGTESPRPGRLSTGCESFQGSSAEPAQPSPYANWPCDGKSCQAQPCSSVHIWAATSRVLKTCP